MASLWKSKPASLVFSKSSDLRLSVCSANSSFLHYATVPATDNSLRNRHALTRLARWLLLPGTTDWRRFSHLRRVSCCLSGVPIRCVSPCLGSQCLSHLDAIVSVSSAVAGHGPSCLQQNLLAALTWVQLSKPRREPLHSTLCPVLSMTIRASQRKSTKPWHPIHVVPGQW